MKQLNFPQIGQRIHDIRISHNLTQEFLAQKAGVNLSHINNIETGKVKVSLTLLVNICNALDVTLDYLLENEYHTSHSILETELLNTIKNMDNTKLEILLKIAKAL